MWQINGAGFVELVPSEGMAWNKRFQKTATKKPLFLGQKMENSSMSFLFEGNYLTTDAWKEFLFLLKGEQIV